MVAVTGAVMGAGYLQMSGTLASMYKTPSLCYAKFRHDVFIVYNIRLMGRIASLCTDDL